MYYTYCARRSDLKIILAFGHVYINDYIEKISFQTMCEKYAIIDMYIYNVAIVRVIKVAGIKNSNNNRYMVLL